MWTISTYLHKTFAWKFIICHVGVHHCWGCKIWQPPWDHVLNLVFSKPEWQFLRKISIVACKISENKWRQHIGLQMYELEIIQFKIDCIFWINQDGSHFINGDHIKFPLWQPSWMAYWMLFVLSKAFKLNYS